ncbi:rhodanese-like domain-containing protein [Aliidiomarina soli]|uniref:Sulfurtransferase n=1 Tax=Aliidiomarina soli TaxID=1928574 RepID=A0A432WHD7_9GAMM|nr:rhodanese-like domain-containing protein [Aliidiomarina soli]RUO33127.1 sulfurtransferase [Aliidiomarina soli]
MKTAQQLVAEAKQAIVECSVDELAQVTESDALIIDIREPAEYSDHHIKEAINLPRGVLEFQLANHPSVAASGCEPMVALEQLKARPTYLICRSGGRSALAAESLQKMGLEKVFSVAGGMQAWVDSGKPTV